MSRERGYYEGDEEEGLEGRDLYEILGVQKDASDAEIKKAYRLLAKKHHPDRRQSSPHASDETFKDVGNAYKILSDPHRRALYDMGGSSAVEEHEGLNQMGLDQVLLGILMWEPHRKASLGLLLLLLLLECCAAPLLVCLKLDEALTWPWLWVLCPLWAPLLLFCPAIGLAPLAILRQGGGAEQVRSCVGCVVAGVLVGGGAWTVGMLWARLEGREGSSFFSATYPYMVAEGLLALSFVGLPVRQVLEGMAWKALRVGFVVLFALRLDGYARPSDGGWLSWEVALAPLQMGAVLAALALGGEVLDHHARAESSAGRDSTHDDKEVSQYASFFHSLRACLLLGFLLTVLLWSCRIEGGMDLQWAVVAAPFLASLVAAYAVVLLALFFVRAVGDEYAEVPPGGGGGYGAR